MNDIEPIFAKVTLLSCFVQNAHTEYHVYPDNSLIAGTRLQTDGRTDVVCNKAGFMSSKSPKIDSHHYLIGQVVIDLRPYFYEVIYLRVY